jgi:hypothetical protein
MRSSARSDRPITALAILAVVAGCAGAPPSSPPSPPLASTPQLLGEPMPVSEEPAPIEREPDLAPRDRWLSPFAVSATGSVPALERRSVVVLDADPVIAAGIAEQEAIELNGPAGRGNAANPSRSVGGPSASRAGGAAQARVHRVQRGDTWSGIAVQYRVPPRALADANPDVDPEAIQIGQTLIIPGTD